jgi:hypothetical protein
MNEKVKMEVRWQVEKFDAKDSEEIVKKNLKPIETIKTGPNCLLYGTATDGEGIGNIRPHGPKLKQQLDLAEDALAVSLITIIRRRKQR